MNIENRQNSTSYYKYLNNVNFDHRSSAKISLKSFEIQNLSPIWPFSLLKPSEIASSSNSRWQNRKERPNQCTNNGYVVKKAKRLCVSE